MQTDYVYSGEKLIMVWSFFSAMVFFVGHFLFWLWLLRRKAKMIFSCTGTPGYLEFVYVSYCRSLNRPLNRGFLLFRALSFINVIVSIIFCMKIIK